jgi:hemoglobin
MIKAKIKNKVNANTLFERLGEIEGITAIVDDVIEAHMNNPTISATF